MSREREPLRRLWIRHRRDLRELEELGIDRRELKDAVRNCHSDGDLPRGSAPGELALTIAAELAGMAQLPTAVNWDKIIEIIERLMPLIEAWIEACM